MEPKTRLAEDSHERWVVLMVEGQRYALGIDCVDYIVRAAEVTPLPEAPTAVRGVIDIAGDVLPVFDLRQRLGLPLRPIDITDQFVLARAGSRRVAVIVDETLGVVTRPATSVTPIEAVVCGVEHIRGLLGVEDGIILVHDLEKFLSPEESAVLNNAMKRRDSNGS